MWSVTVILTWRWAVPIVPSSQGTFFFHLVSPLSKELGLLLEGLGGLVLIRDFGRGENQAERDKLILGRRMVRRYPVTDGP